jgi:hypothetical protein
MGVDGHCKANPLFSLPGGPTHKNTGWRSQNFEGETTDALLDRIERIREAVVMEKRVTDEFLQVRIAPL